MVLVSPAVRIGTGGLMEKSKLLSDIVQKLLHFSKPQS